MQQKRLPSFLSTQVKVKTPLKVGESTINSSNRSTSPSIISPQQGIKQQSSRLLNRKTIVFIVFIVFIIFAFISPQFGFNAFELWFDNDYLNSKLANTYTVNNEPIPVAQTSSLIDEGAFVFIAVGSEGNHMKCSAAIESLIRHSGWGGEVYLIYDNEYCFSTESILQESGITREKLHLIFLNQ